MLPKYISSAMGGKLTSVIRDGIIISQFVLPITLSVVELFTTPPFSSDRHNLEVQNKFVYAELKRCLLKNFKIIKALNFTVPPVTTSNPGPSHSHPS